MRKKFFAVPILILFSIILLPFQLLHDEEKSGLLDGQTIYVPAYSNIYVGNKEMPFLLTVTLSIRNIDPKHQIKITIVDYYETQGNL